MTLGYAGHARLEAEDDGIAIYSYTGEDWNVQDESARDALVSDSGQFAISKSCLIEPEIHSKVRKLNGRKRLVEKTVVRDPDLADLIERGGIVVENCASSTPRHRSTILEFTHAYFVSSSGVTR